MSIISVNLIAGRTGLQLVLCSSCYHLNVNYTLRKVTQLLAINLLVLHYVLMLQVFQEKQSSEHHSLSLSVFCLVHKCPEDEVGTSIVSDKHFLYNSVILLHVSS